MPLPPDFQFSQASLQDYADCPRRFELRYLEQLAWPAVSAEPVEAHEAQIADGEAFHRLVHQHVVGLSAERLRGVAAAEAALRGAVEPGLPAWWENYLADPPADLPAQRYAEVGLSAPLGAHRLVAKFDLIAVEPGRAVIVDWKTGGRRPASAWLTARLQTRVYRWLLAVAGAHLNGGLPLRPEQIEMIYWFAAYPDEPLHLRYDATQHAADGAALRELLAEIAARADGDFPLTDDPKRCRFCVYRSLCGRGVAAGDMDAADADADAAAAAEAPAADWQADFDFEQVAEVAF